VADDDGFIECSNGDTYVYTGSRVFGPGKSDLVGWRCSSLRSAVNDVARKYGGIATYDE